MVQVIRYNEKYKEDWNKFVANSKNGTFLFNRNYMDYHSRLYTDSSLMFYKGEELIAILPANINNDVLVTHGYLTYGGLVINCRMKTPLMLDLFEELNYYLTSIGVKQLIYKAIPYIYHSKPAEEDLYALFRNNAKLLKREVSTCIYIPKFESPGNRRNGYNKSVRNNLVLKLTDDFTGFILLVNRNLKEKYGLKAVHTANDLKLLHDRFPENIKLFGAYKGDLLLGGTIIFQNRTVVHAQYLHASPEGRKVRCLDFILITLLKEYYKDFVYFDFGHSTEDGGKYLNESLINQKEEFGGSAVCYDTYQLDL